MQGWQLPNRVAVNINWLVSMFATPAKPKRSYLFRFLLLITSSQLVRFIILNHLVNIKPLPSHQPQIFAICRLYWLYIIRHINPSKLLVIAGIVPSAIDRYCIGKTAVRVTEYVKTVLFFNW